VKRRLIVVLAGLAAAAMLSLGPSAAAVQSCTVSTTAVRFGAYNRSSPTDLATTGGVIFNCSQRSPITIQLDRGGSGSFARRLSNGSGGLLSYNLFFDAAGTTIWGDGTGGTQFFSTASPIIGKLVNIPVFGIIPHQQQNLQAGDYTDQITVTISF
jgi:spore coat protein U-like protein